jgi:hypothetical protein
MQLDPEEGRLTNIASTSLVVTTAGMLEYSYKEDASLCPQNKAKSRQQDSKQKCSAAGIYRNVMYVTGAGIDFKSMDNKIYPGIRKIKESSMLHRTGKREMMLQNKYLYKQKMGSIK